MPTYIALLNYTQKGMENIKESADRLEEAKKAFQAMGAELKESYLVLGRYDLVIVCEAPDDETMAKLSLVTGSRGSVRGESLRAFNSDEFKKIVSSLP